MNMRFSVNVCVYILFEDLKMKICQYCDTKVEDKVYQCPNCSSPAFFKRCTKCDKNYEGPVCPYCADKVWAEVDSTNFSAKPEPEEKKVEEGVSTKSKLLAMVLCLFFGTFGVHNFYAGRIGKGILYLCTQGLFGLGVLYDFIMLAINKYKDKNGLTISEW